MKKLLILMTLVFSCAGCSQSSDSISGYIEGEYTYIASGIAGTLHNLNVSRGQEIKKGELLYELDPEPEKAQVAVTKANIENLKTQISFLRTQLDRQKSLYKTNATSKVSLDQAQTDLDSKLNQLSGSEAELIQTTWSLQQKTIQSMVSGRVFDTYYRVGEKVPANSPVLSLLVAKNIKVLFYIPEKMLSQMKVGDKISFTCDGCETTQATINYISPEAEYTPPVIYSKDTRYKLVYLVRAKMPDDIARKFHPGQPIEVNVSHE